MTLALCGSVYTLPSKMGSILEDIVKSEVEEESGEAFNDEERKTCVSTIVRHKPIVTWFSRVLSETASLKRLNLKCKYFELLGYRHINRAAKEKKESAQSQQERLHEQKHAKENIFKLEKMAFQFSLVGNCYLMKRSDGQKLKVITLACRSMTNSSRMMQQSRHFFSS